MLKKGDKIGIVCCSNGQQKIYEDKIRYLIDIINEIGLISVCSDYIFEKESIYSGTAKERADALMKMYEDTDIKAIFDISGGDIANEVLEYLDYRIIADSNKIFYGYSDLTTIINSIYSKTAKKSGLYQIRNLMYDNANVQQEKFINTLLMGKTDLCDISYYFIQGCYMKGVVVGGNIRCLLKLAGTEYFPDMQDKILLLEALNASSAQVITYLVQMRQMGVFSKISGILLGTFTKLDGEIFVPSIEELIQRYAGNDIPVARTMDIGHGTDAKCIYIGEIMEFKEN